MQVRLEFTEIVAGDSATAECSTVAVTAERMPRTHVNLEDFPDSPYAHELQIGTKQLRFKSDALEAEYVESHVEHARLRTKIWLSITLAINTVFTILQLNTELWSAASLVHVGLLMPSSIALVWLVWGKYYERHYLSWSRILVPLINTLICVFVARGMGQGGSEELSGPVLYIIATFFFSGLMYRDAVSSASIIVVGFLTACVAYGVPLAALAQYTVVVGLTAIMGAIVSRDMEKSHRKGFLEGALIAEMAARDGLTGLMNRRSFDEHLLRVWQHALRDRRSIAVLMIDIDHFKQYNDSFGHQAGDVALRSVARAIQEFARRPLDLAGRFGGEEFAVIFYDLPLQHVRDMGERIRQRIVGLKIARPQGADSAEAMVTVSIGIGLALPTIGRTPHGAVQLADEALYDAKRAGRNCIVVKGDEDYQLLDTGSFKASKFSRI